MTIKGKKYKPTRIQNKRKLRIINQMKNLNEFLNDGTDGPKGGRFSGGGGQLGLGTLEQCRKQQ